MFGYVTHLAVDLDNTLVDTLTACLDCFNRLSGREFARNHCEWYEFYELYGWDEKKYLQTYAAHGAEIHTRAEPYGGALEVMRALAGRMRVTILTARPQVYADITLEWLERYGVPYDAISFNHDKLRACESMGAQLLVDDTPWYAETFLHAGRPIVLMDHPYNRYLPEHPLIRRVESWAELGRLFLDA